MRWLKRLLGLGGRGDRSAADELQSRLTKPQRHRLLHGYPQSAAMFSADQLSPDLDLQFRSGLRPRKLLLGILPHPYCNPAVTGCGFCTFPHEAGNSAKSEQVVSAVTREIYSRLSIQEELRGTSITGLYFGGGTANLTAPGPFEKLCKTLASSFDFAAAEVTLEGVPANFLKEPLLVEIMREHLPARHGRISMGIQTFSEAWLRRMGRLAFGTADTFRQVVSMAHAKGLTVSADMLINLPGQTLDEMLDDLRQAIEIGLDHIGVYHLVLFEKLGTAWSQDQELLSALPNNQQAAENWLAVREFLLANGFYQTTLTNFERSQFRGQPNRFLYEECSFQPDLYEVLGFGPSAISYVVAPFFDTGIKTQNPEGAADYMHAVDKDDRVWNRYFVYSSQDQRVAYLTRRLAGLEICRQTYRVLFKSDPVTDFPEECAALSEAGLLTIDKASLRPTPRGMFYADSIAALWAWKQIRARRSQRGKQQELPLVVTLDRTGYLNDSRYHHMG